MSIKLLNKIELKRKLSLINFHKNGNDRLVMSNPPPVKASGLYWIYTSYSLNELKSCTPSNDTGAIQINELAKLHDGLEYVCKISDQNYRVVYNGIAGNSCGIRQRIRQHFNGGQGTGCLSISKSSLNDLSKWRVSYVTIDSELPEDIQVPASYNEHAKNIERMWRLRYGWPLLCRS